MLASDELDVVFALLVVDPAQRPRRAFAALGRARATRPDKPVVLVAPGALADAARGIPGVTVYRTIVGATASLGRAMRYAEWRRVADDRPVVELGTRGEHARDLGARPARGPRRRAGVAARRRDDRAVGAVRDLAGGHGLRDGGCAAGRRGAGLPGRA